MSLIFAPWLFVEFTEEVVKPLPGVLPAVPSFAGAARAFAATLPARLVLFFEFFFFLRS